MATSTCNNCGCKKCGCQDDFLTTPPACPTPIGCPDPEPCSEIIDAECIVYTGLDIECNDDIVVETDTTLADALVDIVTYFCDNGGGGGTGPAGPVGPPGIQGAQGVAGPTGPQGTAGSAGGAGATGATGPQGIQGVAGPVGPAGLNWQGSWSALGVYAPDDAVGYAGASWFCLNAVGPFPSNPTIDPTNWALLASEGAVGPAGPTGASGVAGAAGATGPQGPTGSTGSQGIQGIPGPTGAQGIQGIQGIPGSSNPLYKVYTAILTRTGATAPSAIVLENTLGVITFSYGTVGLYYIFGVNLFTLDKTVVFITETVNAPGKTLSASRINANNIVMVQYGSSSASDSDWIDPVSIEIRVYN